MKRIYVGNLPFDADEDGLRKWFAQAGIAVQTLTLVRDRFTHELRGFGFVDVSDDDAQRAIDTLNGQVFQGRNLVINEARPQRERREGRGGFGRGGGRGGGRGPRRY